MSPSQLFHVFTWDSGKMRRFPFSTASKARLAISPQRTYHWAFKMGSMMSFQRLKEKKLHFLRKFIL
jgi:hypothetical protein